ncbi:MAG TPA: LysR substrate-binding domain-containing protein [Buttiauxella sp.]|uniref:LysR substrate-binding domain-containing protein n=1 Tax=Buttiauxella sp. TaxID=1972222 RepID=UPI002B463953|nr:LysR substrate-binding domain-containing protein [Buttiauxella sp.]HKM95715.1 LysR substrate-binding domain-containing protein [Buttiauxella sp.]
MQIRAFCQVAAHGTVSRAADNLFRTQSAITRSIRDLEHSLSIKLFERHASGMLLTEFGKCIFPRARQAIDELKSIPKIIASVKGKEIAGRELAEPIWLYNTRRLEVFMALFQVHHTQTVADMFQVSQPAVSAALKMLEKGAGLALFQRTPKGMMPTRAGQEIASNISRTLNELRHIPADIAAHQGILRGSVHIGALPLGRTRLLPEAILNLLVRFPGVNVITNESAFTSLISELRAGNVDFIFGALRDGTADITNEALFTEEMVILARRNHPLSQGAVSVEQLAAAQWILPRAATPARKLLSHTFGQLGIAEPQPRVETGDLAITRSLLLNSDMLTAISSHQLEYELAAGVLVKLPVELPNTHRAIGLTWRQGALHSPAAQALLQAIREVVGNYQPVPPKIEDYSLPATE